MYGNEWIIALCYCFGLQNRYLFNKSPHRSLCTASELNKHWAEGNERWTYESRADRKSFTWAWQIALTSSASNTLFAPRTWTISQRTPHLVQQLICLLSSSSLSEVSSVIWGLFFFFYLAHSASHKVYQSAIFTFACTIKPITTLCCLSPSDLQHWALVQSVLRAPEWTGGIYSSDVWTNRRRIGESTGKTQVDSVAETQLLIQRGWLTCMRQKNLTSLQTTHKPCFSCSRHR